MAGPADFVLNPLPSSVQWNTGAFTLRQVAQAPSGGHGMILYHSAGDLTGDGWPEIVISGWSYRGWDAAGTPPEAPITILSTHPGGVTTSLDSAALLGRGGSPGTAILRIADFTGDGRNDLMMVGHNESPFVNTPSYLFTNTGAGFTASLVGPKVAAHEGEVGDINGDGRPDMVLSAYWAEKTLEPYLYSGNGGNWVQAQGASGAVLLLQVNQGDGTFRPLPLAFDRTLAELQAGEPWKAQNWSSGSSSVIADLDGDGRAEVIVTDLYSSQDWKRGDTYLITDIKLGDTLASGQLIKLPAPYFEDKPEYAGMKSLFPGEISHDIQVQVLDFDNDGRLDLIVNSMVWTDAPNSPAGITQFLRNKGGLQFEDVTDKVLFNSWLGKAESSHEQRLMDVNGDGFIDIVNPGSSQLSANGQTPKTWSNEVLVNTGAGKFVSVMWDQFHTLTTARADGGWDFSYFPYMTPDARLGFITFNYDQTTIRYWDVQAPDRMFTGPGGANPALRGAAGFNEAYYLTENPTVAQAVSTGAYASGLDHFLAVGRAQGLQGFAANARVEGSAGNDIIILREGAEKAFGGAGADTIQGGAGLDYLRGEDGDDSISGGADFDDTHGNAGNDTVFGGLGDDWVVGGKDNDLLRGEDGDDIVYGNLGDDTCEGGAGNDIVRGGQNNDIVLGGEGDDWLAGDKGDDTLTGGAGADIFHTHGEAGLDRVTDFNLAEGDRVYLLPGTQYTLAQEGADLAINMVGGGKMVLVGVQLASLSGDWIFGA